MSLLLLVSITICSVVALSHFGINVIEILLDKFYKWSNDGSTGTSRRRYSAGTHVVISGGSRGIGKSLALKFAELGVHVTIIARDIEALRQAQSEIEKRRKREWQKINCVSLDLSNLSNKISSKDDDQSSNNGNGNNAKTSKRQAIIDKILGDHDRCDILINCCGSAMAARFDETTYEQFNYMMQVNYFSAVNLTKLFLPLMKQRSLSTSNATRLTTNSSNSHIVFVSSMTGLVSFFGCSAYSASKFALVGLAQALQMELKPFDIDVTIAFPPNTQTPGFDQENHNKPDLTKKISESSGHVYQADEVANQLIRDIALKKFYSVVGYDNQLLICLFNTFMPVHSVMTLVLECFYVGIAKFIGSLTCRSWYNLVSQARASEQIRARLAMKSSK